MAKNVVEISLVDGISKGLLSINEGVNGVGASFVKLDAIISVVEKGFDLISGAARGLADLVQPAANLEDALAAVQAVTGATASEFALLKDAAEGAAERTRFTAVEAAGGLAELARAGYSATEAIDALNPALNLAQGNNIEVAQSAELLSTTITQFGLAAKDAAGVADVLQKTSDATSTSVSQLGLALSYAAPNAKALGFTLEETAAAIGVLANNGLRGERAGTVLREAFVQLQQPTSKLSEALADAGVKVDSISGLFAALGNDSALASKAMVALGVTGASLGPLVEDAGKSIAGLTKQLQDADGAAQKTADTLGATFNSALARLTNSFEQAKITLFEPLLEPLSKEIDLLAKQIFEFTKSEDFAALAQKIKDFTLIGVASIKEFIQEFDFDVALASANKFISDFNSNLTSLRATFDSVKPVVTAFEITFSAIAAAINTAQLTFNGLSFSLQKFAQFSASVNSEIRGSFGLSTESVDNFAQSMKDAADASGEDAKRNLIELGGAFDSIGTAAFGASGEVSTLAEESRAPLADLGDTAEVVGQQIDTGLAEAIRKANTGIFTSEDAAKKLRVALDEAFNSKKTIEDAEALRLQLIPIFQKLGLDIKLVTEALTKFEDELAAGLDAQEKAKKFEDAMALVRDALGAILTSAEGAQEKFNTALKGLFTGTTEQEASQLRVAVAREMLEMGASIETVEKAMEGLNQELSKPVKEDPLKALTESFKLLKIESQEAANETAKKTSAAFDQIVAAAKRGDIEISNVRAAFIAYAKSQLDAVKNADELKRSQVESALASKAAASGLSESLAEMGIVGKDAGEKVAAGVRAIKPAADDAANSVQGVSNALNNAGNAANSATTAFNGNSSALITNANAAEESAFFIGEMSDALARQLAGAAGNVQETARLTEEIYRQRDAASDRIAQIEKEIALYDPLQKQLEAVKNKYRGIGDEQARALAAQEQRLADLRDRANGGAGSGTGTQTGGGTTNVIGGAAPGQTPIVFNLALSALDPKSLDPELLNDLARQLTRPLRSIIASAG